MAFLKKNFSLCLKILVGLVGLTFLILKWNDPKSNFQTIASIVALIPITFESIQKLIQILKAKDNHALLDFDSKNIFLTTLIDKVRGVSSPAIGFYSFSIVNNSSENFTLKEVILEYEIDGKTFKVESIVLLTGIVNSPHYDKPVKSIIQNFFSGDKIILLNWYNIRSLIGDKKKLTTGEVITGSALFLFHFSNLESFDNISGLKIIISDFNRKTSQHSIPIESKWKQSASHSYIDFNEDYSMPIDERFKENYELH